MARWFMDAPLAWQAFDELALANLFHKSNPKLNKLILRVIHRKLKRLCIVVPRQVLGFYAKILGFRATPPR
jgi:hypothetical protein